MPAPSRSASRPAKSWAVTVALAFTSRPTTRPSSAYQHQIDLSAAMRPEVEELRSNATPAQLLPQLGCHEGLQERTGELRVSPDPRGRGTREVREERRVDERHLRCPHEPLGAIARPRLDQADQERLLEEHEVPLQRG